ncbi:unnamed protein product, partial [marine sediment metagenome]
MGNGLQVAIHESRKNGLDSSNPPEKIAQKTGSDKFDLYRSR